MAWRRRPRGPLAIQQTRTRAGLPAIYSATLLMPNVSCEDDADGRGIALLIPGPDRAAECGPLPLTDPMTKRCRDHLLCLTCRRWFAL